MSVSKIVLTTIALGLAAATPAGADWVDDREAKLRQRYEDARRSGTITYSEGKSLRGELAEIEAVEQRYRASHGLSKHEKRDLARRLEAAENNVRAQEYDDQRRWRILPRVGK